MDQQEIGLFLRKLREENGMTQEQLAESVGVSNRTISRWENGKNLPDLSILVQLSELFDVSFNEIVNAKKESENEQMEEKEKGAILQLAKMYRNEKYVYPRKFNILLAFGIIGVIVFLLNVDEELNYLAASLMAGILSVAFYINTAYILFGKAADGPLAGVGEKVYLCTYMDKGGMSGHIKQTENELRFYPQPLHKTKEVVITAADIISMKEEQYLLIAKILVIKAKEKEYRFRLEKKDRAELISWYKS